MAVPELLGFQINHRAMRGEVRRLAGLATELAAGRQSADAARTTAIAGFITTLSHGIHHHHTMEDQLLWPAIQRSAGAEVDLRDLSDDHSELDSLLTELNDRAAAFVSTGDGGRSAARWRSSSLHAQAGSARPSRCPDHGRRPRSHRLLSA
jgi:iron-sulfur cluster repair protein YtfE (RIC family)